MAKSKLQEKTGYILRKEFSSYHIHENYRPVWLLSSNLTRLELDFYIEDISIALEIQGGQHYEFIPYFHGNTKNFEKQKLYDKEKEDLCYGKNIKLIKIHTKRDVDIFVNDIKEKFLGILPNKPINRKAIYSFLKPKTKEDEILKFREFARRRIKEGKKDRLREFDFKLLNKDEINNLIKSFL